MTCTEWNQPGLSRDTLTVPLILNGWLRLTYNTPVLEYSEVRNNINTWCGVCEMKKLEKRNTDLTHNIFDITNIDLR